MNYNIIKLIESRIDKNLNSIADFFDKKTVQFPPLIYNSVDLRHSGFKITPVDTNCFPAGFNNISGSYLEKASLEAKLYLQKFFDFDNIKNIAILGENHTRNLHYLSSLENLKKAFTFNDKNTFLGSIDQQINDSIQLQNSQGKIIDVHKLEKKNGKIFINQDIAIDLIILNNDLTNQVPDLLQSIETKVIPSVQMGWHQRSKFKHFDLYNTLCQEISTLIDIDPWFISNYQSHLNSINFKDRIGFDKLEYEVEQVIVKTNAKYQEYNINQKPFCYIKSDNGTYGMAVMKISSPEEIRGFNKKARNKMNMIKDGRQTSSIKIQEGVPTIDTINGHSSEPLIYMLNGTVIANLARSNEFKDNQSSLNSQGAKFHNIEQEYSAELGGELSQVTKAYWLVAKLASLAASIEYDQCINIK